MIARGVSCGPGCEVALFISSPAAALTLVLSLQPREQRREVFRNRCGVHLASASQLFQCVRPRLALTERKHFAETPACLFVAEDGALVQRTFEAGGITQRFVELELQNV